MKRILGRAFGRLRGAQRAFGRDERAATAIEFGILSVPFFGIIAAILQTSIILLASQILESAVNDASRAIRIGQAASFTVDTFRSRICDGLYGLFGDCSGLHVQVSEITNFQSANAPPPVAADCEAPCDWSNPERWTAGQGKSIMLVQVYYRYPVLIPLGPLGMSNLPDGSRLIGSTNVFQNEPFS